jgi:hypothetical protein
MSEATYQLDSFINLIPKLPEKWFSEEDKLSYHPYKIYSPLELKSNSYFPSLSTNEKFDLVVVFREY